VPERPDAVGWAGYYAARLDREPRPLLVEAVDMVPRPGRAVDLGAGAGIDTRFLLESGWRVTAIDNDPDALRRLSELGGSDGALEVRHGDLDEQLDLGSVDLVHAGFSLPFCRPDRFAALWRQLEGALDGGGVLAGQLFGDRDSWAGVYDDMTFHTTDEVDMLLRGWDVRRLEIEDRDGTSYVGPKHWHLLHVLARRH